MKLISMTDFVLQQSKSPIHRTDIAFNCIQYAKFLKQPLTIDIFTPCDENGNPLAKPRHYSSFLNEYYLDKPGLIDYEICSAYKKAETKVLFKGFEIYDILLINNDLGIAYNIEEFEHWDIEVLEAIHSDIELTESAINQIFD